MDDSMRKLPKYVFRRANGSYRYKRNVPKELRAVIPKATVYRQLGASYDEAIRALPLVHAEIEALFDRERRTPDSERADQIVRERLSAWQADAFKEGAVDPEWDVYDDFQDLAEDLKGVNGVTKGALKQIKFASQIPEPLTLDRILDVYLEFKSDDAGETRSLATRIARL